MGLGGLVPIESQYKTLDLGRTGRAFCVDNLRVEGNKSSFLVTTKKNQKIN